MGSKGAWCGVLRRFRPHVAQYEEAAFAGERNATQDNARRRAGPRGGNAPGVSLFQQQTMQHVKLVVVCLSER